MNPCKLCNSKPEHDNGDKDDYVCKPEEISCSNQECVMSEMWLTEDEWDKLTDDESLEDVKEAYALLFKENHELKQKVARNERLTKSLENKRRLPGHDTEIVNN